MIKKTETLEKATAWLIKNNVWPSIDAKHKFRSWMKRALGYKSLRNIKIQDIKTSHVVHLFKEMEEEKSSPHTFRSCAQALSLVIRKTEGVGRFSMPPYPVRVSQVLRELNRKHNFAYKQNNLMALKNSGQPPSKGVALAIKAVEENDVESILNRATAFRWGGKYAEFKSQLIKLLEARKVDENIKNKNTFAIQLPAGTGAKEANAIKVVVKRTIESVDKSPHKVIYCAPDKCILLIFNKGDSNERTSKANKISGRK